MDLSDENDEEDWTQPMQIEAEVKGDNACTTSIFLATAEAKNKDYVVSTSKFGHNRTIIHIDMDCFYAQVEMLRNPDLRNKPLGVQQKYIVVTCNYKAREYGVTKLMSIKDAKEKCPQLVLVCGEDLTHYRDYSYRISEFLLQYTSNVERLGFDENYLDVTDTVRQMATSGQFSQEVKGHVYSEGGEVPATTCKCGCHERLIIGSQIAADIREALFTEMGVTSCAGISYNKLLSKLIGSQHKPNQQTTLFPGEVSEFIGKMEKAHNIPGIGHATSKKLAGMGVSSVLDLQNCNLVDLEEEFGYSLAVTMKQLCHGIDDSPVIMFGKPQTLSDEDSFKKCCTERDVRKKCRELLANLIHRLMEDGRIPHTIRLTIRKLTTANKWTNRESRQCSVPAHIVSNLMSEKFENSKVSDELEGIVMNLFRRLINTDQPFHLTLMNIAFCNLNEIPKKSISSFFSPKAPKLSVSTVQEKQPCFSAKTLASSTVVKKEVKGLGLSSWMSRQLKTDKLCLDKDVDKDDFQHKLIEIQNVQETTLLSSESASSSLSQLGTSSAKRKVPFISAVTNTPVLKRNKIEGQPYSTTTKAISSNILDDMLPKCYDREVFLQLPKDIQQELLQSTSVSTPLHTSKDIQQEFLQSTSVSMPLHTSNADRVVGCVTSVTSSCTGSSNHSLTTGIMGQCQGHTSDCQVVCEQTNYEAHSHHKNSQQVTTSESQSHTQLPYLVLENIKQSLPADVNEEVFCNLPVDIQKEYIDQWSARQLCPASQTHHKSKKVSPASKNRSKAAGCTSIAQYFQTHSKKS